MCQDTCYVQQQQDGQYNASFYGQDKKKAYLTSGKEKVAVMLRAKELGKEMGYRNVRAIK